jgi:KDO2-lipid IV(A) lauroyltransferase
MKRLGARLLVALIERTADWSQSARSGLGFALGAVLWWLVWPRRRVALANLRLCFPDWSDAERRRVARSCFRNLARAFVDHGVLATAPREDVERYVEVRGGEILREAMRRPLILVAPHFVGLDAGGVRMSLYARCVSIYARSRNPEWDRWLLAIRTRFNDPVLIQREGFDLRAAVRALKDGLPFYYLPDQDPGARNGVFVPFFGVAAATLPMVPRLAKMASARVAMCVTEMTATGYVLHIEPPWADYPSGDVQADTARMNAEIERWVRRLPDQYLWTHKRFKTRPPEEPSRY